MRRDLSISTKICIDSIGRLNEREQLELDFKDSLSRTVKERMEQGFIFKKLPIIDDSPYRIFNTMKEYRDWANKNLPKWLGYNSVKRSEIKSKKAAKRQRDKEELPRLEAFRKELRK